jgi:hypothetical protein
MEAICFSETSINFYQTKWHHIPEDDTLHSRHLENIKSHSKSLCDRVGCVTMITIVGTVLTKGSSATHSTRPAALSSLHVRTSNVLEPHTAVMAKMIVVITLMKLVVPVSTSQSSE